MGLILCFAISNTTIKGQKLAFKQGVTEELKATDMMIIIFLGIEKVMPLKLNIFMLFMLKEMLY